MMVMMRMQTVVIHVIEQTVAHARMKVEEDLEWVWSAEEFGEGGSGVAVEGVEAGTGAARGGRAARIRVAQVAWKWGK